MQTNTEHTAENTLFDNLLSYETCLPATFMPGQGLGRLGHAESLLNSLALVEDHRLSEDSQSERDEGSLFSQRLEAKLDLNLLLLGRLLQQARAPLPARKVRWSIRGVRLEQPDTTELTPGIKGILQIQPCDWLPESLELPASVLAIEPGQWLWLCFPTFAPSLNDTLERHLFRQHRRQIAQSRTLSDE